MQDYKKLGDLGDVASLLELLQMADNYITIQDKEITKCAGALKFAFQSKL